MLKIRNFFEVEHLNKWFVCRLLPHIPRPPFIYLYTLNVVTNLETQEQTWPLLTTFPSSQKSAFPSKTASWAKVVVLEDGRFIMINFDSLAWLPCVSQSCWWVGTCQEWECVWVRLLYSSQIGFSTSRAFDISEASGSMEGLFFSWESCWRRRGSFPPLIHPWTFFFYVFSCLYKK